MRAARAYEIQVLDFELNRGSEPTGNGGVRSTTPLSTEHCALSKVQFGPQCYDALDVR